MGSALGGCSSNGLVSHGWDVLMVAVILMRTWPSFGVGIGRESKTIGFPISVTKSAFCILLFSVRTCGDCVLISLERLYRAGMQ